MQKTFCDRCNMECSDAEVIVSTIIYKESAGTEAKHDLCNPCTTTFREFFMKNSPTEPHMPS